MISQFKRLSELTMVKQMMDKVNYQFGHLLRDPNQPWLSEDNLIMFADAIQVKVVAL